MTIQRLQLSNFDTNNGVTEDAAIYHNLAPSLLIQSGEYCIKDFTTLDNDALTFHLRISNSTSCKFRMIVGCDGSGSGHVVDFDIQGTTQNIYFGTASTFTGARTSTIETYDISNLYMFKSSHVNFHKIVLKLINGDIYIQINGIYLFKLLNQTLTGSNIAFSGLDTANDVHVSDIDWYKDQIFWGNINLNGVPDANGIVRVYNQASHALEYEENADVDGNYAVLIEDDPDNSNTYYMIGYIQDLTGFQPRGVGNITL